MRVGSRGLALAAAAVVALGACGAGSGQQYLSNRDVGLYMRFPDDWDRFELSGESRPASRVPEIWSYSFDAADHPDANHWAETGLPSPSGFVQVTGLLTSNPRDGISLQYLRTRSLGGTQDPLALIEDGSDDVELVSYDEPVTDGGFYGIRITLNVRLDATTYETFTHLAMVDPEHERLYELRVGCDSACFVDNADTIGDIFDSFTIEEDR